MSTKINEKIKSTENYTVRDFKEALKKYQGASFTLYFPKEKGNSAIIESSCGYYQAIQYAVICKIDNVIYSVADASDKEMVLQNYVEFEERLAEEEFTGFSICLHKKMTGICAENDEEILLEGGKGYFLCAMAILTDAKNAEGATIQYALFSYNPANDRYSELNYYKINEELFDLIFEFTRMAGDCHEGD